MTTLILQPIGTAIGKILATAAGVEGVTGGVAAAGQVGGQIGAYAGLFLDSFLISNKLFAAQPLEGQKLDELEIASFSEGKGHARVFGTRRVAARVGFMSDLREIKDSAAGGGKGGSGGEFLTYKYRNHVFCIFSDHPFGPVPSRIIRVWSDAKIFYDEEPDLIYDSDQIAAEVQTVISFGGTWDRLVLRNTDGSVDLSKYKSGGLLVVSGFTGAALPNNSDNSPIGAWRIVTAKEVSVTETFVKVEHPFLGTPPSIYGFVGKAAGTDTVHTEQEFPTHKKGQVGDISFLMGGDDQQVPDLLEDELGVGNSPAYRKRSAMLLEDLLVTDFGNRTPSFEAELEVESGPTLDIFVRRAVTEAGMAEGDIDVSGLVSETIRGYMIRGPQSTARSMQAPALAKDIVSRNEDGIQYFYLRKDAPTIAVANADLAAHEVGTDAHRPFQVQDDSDLGMPRELHVQFDDPDEDYQLATGKAFNAAAPYRQPDVIDVRPVVLTGLEGDALSQKLMFARLSARQQVSFNLPHTYLALGKTPGSRSQVTEGKILQVLDEMGDDWDIMIHRVEIGENWVVHCEGRVEDPATLTQTGKFDPPIGPDTSLTERRGTQDIGGTTQPPSYMEWELLDIANLRDEEHNRIGMYWAVRGGDPRVPFRGASIWMSTDAGLNFTRLQFTDREAVMGGVTAAATTVVLPEFADRTNTIRVELIGTPELRTVTEDEMLAGRNRGVILTSAGPEVIGWQTATLISSDPNVYDLSTLLRGLRNTEDAMGAHAVGDRFVWLDGPGLDFVPLNAAAVNRAAQWKVLTLDQALSEVRPVSYTFLGGPIRPFQVHNIQGYWDSDNNLVVTFERRSRAIGTISSMSAPLLEEWERYDIDLSTTGGALKRTKRISLLDEEITDVEVDSPVALTTFETKAQATGKHAIHGALDALSLADTLGAGDSIVLTVGLGRILMVPKAGLGLFGQTFSVTGTSVDRDTGVETPTDTENIITEGFSTDASTTDAGGNTVHDLRSAYQTAKWFKGSITIATNVANLFSNIDVYQVGYEQMNDSESATLQSLDITADALNASATLYAHLYSVVTRGINRCDLKSEADIEFAAATANRTYRLRRGDLGVPLPRRDSGIFLELFLGASTTHWGEITGKVWADVVTQAVRSKERPRFVYTADEQTEDGFTPAIDAVKVAVYQMSARVGRGRKKEVTLTP